MPLPRVLLEHDDGREVVAEVLAQYRVDGRWRALVRYSTAPGYRYEQARWADDLRPAPTSQQPGRAAPP